MTSYLDLRNEPQTPQEYPEAPWYNKHYIGRFATDAEATAEVVARQWDAAGVVPESVWYYNTTSKTFLYWNGTAWTALGSGGAAAFELVSVLPTPSVAYRGTTVVLTGGAGVADIAYICMKTSANTYVWVNIIDADSNLLVKSVVGI